jgi:hypothetical protein
MINKVRVYSEEASSRDEPCNDKALKDEIELYTFFKTRPRETSCQRKDW